MSWAGAARGVEGDVRENVTHRWWLGAIVLSIWSLRRSPVRPVEVFLVMKCKGWFAMPFRTPSRSSSVRRP